MTTILTLVGRKGGITKTTLAVNLAAGCALSGLRTVLVDADGQGNASSSVRVRPHDAFYHLLAENAEFTDVLVPVPDAFAGEGLDFYLLSAWENQRFIESDPQTPTLIYERFNELRGWADVVIVDTPPSITEVHAGFYFVSDYVLLPTLCEFNSILSLESTLAYLAQARQAGRDAGLDVARILGILPNRFYSREKVQRSNIGHIKEKYGGTHRVYDAMRNLTVWNQASQMRRSIYNYAPEDDTSASRRAKTAVKELQPVLDSALALIPGKVAG